LYASYETEPAVKPEGGHVVRDRLGRVRCSRADRGTQRFHHRSAIIGQPGHAVVYAAYFGIDLAHVLDRHDSGDSCAGEDDWSGTLVTACHPD